MVFVPTAFGQKIPEDNTVAMIRANYLYQFAVNNNWPDQLKKGKFKVGVIGNPDVFAQMSSKYGSKPIGSQTLEVISLTELSKDLQIHILYVDKQRRNDIGRFVKELKDNGTLIVTNWEGAIAQGAHLNFRNVDGSIRFEINKNAIVNEKITPGVKILQWAIQ